MKQRGRRSAESLAVVVQGTFGQRVDPPEELSESQAEIWRETVASEDANFFKSAALRGLLMDYCRHRDSARDLSNIIISFNPEWLRSDEGCKRYKMLLAMRAQETSMVVTLATKLRLTNQSRYVPHVAAVAAKNFTGTVGNMPWDDAKKA